MWYTTSSFVNHSANCMFTSSRKSVVLPAHTHTKRKTSHMTVTWATGLSTQERDISPGDSRVQTKGRLVGAWGQGYILVLYPDPTHEERVWWHLADGLHYKSTACCMHSWELITNLHAKKVLCQRVKVAKNFRCCTTDCVFCIVID